MQGLLDQVRQIMNDQLHRTDEPLQWRPFGATGVLGPRVGLRSQVNLLIVGRIGVGLLVVLEGKQGPDCSDASSRTSGRSISAKSADPRWFPKFFTANSLTRAEGTNVRAVEGMRKSRRLWGRRL
jgi:hypothetical protein